MPKRKLTGAERIAAEIRRNPERTDGEIAADCHVSRQRVQFVRRACGIPARPVGAVGKKQYCLRCGEIFPSVSKLLKHLPLCK